jgi:hypothetical protein
VGRIPKADGHLWTLKVNRGNYLVSKDNAIMTKDEIAETSDRSPESI